MTQNDNDDCTETVTVQQAVPLAAKSSTTAKGTAVVSICHYDAVTGTYETLQVDENALQGHVNHANDDLTGACTSLGIEDYNVFGPRVETEIPCGYTEETIELEGKLWYIYRE